MGIYPPKIYQKETDEMWETEEYKSFRRLTDDSGEISVFHRAVELKYLEGTVMSDARHLIVQIGNCSFDIDERTQGPNAVIHTGNDSLLTMSAVNDLFVSLQRNYSAREINVCVLDPEDHLGLKEENIPYCSWYYHGADSWEMAFCSMEEEYQRRTGLLAEKDCYNQAQYAQQCQGEERAARMPKLIFLIRASDLRDQSVNTFLSYIRTGRSLGYHMIMLVPDIDQVTGLIASSCNLYLSLTNEDTEFESRRGFPVHRVYGQNDKKTDVGYPVFEKDKDTLKADLFWKWSLRSVSGKEKTIRLIRGDLTKMQEPCDIVVCSAFRNDYAPINGTLIEALERKGYSFRWLKRSSDFGMQFQDGWISGKTGLEYGRIACIELLDLMKDDPESEESVNIIIKKSFSTLRYMLEQASYAGIPVRTIAMTIPGTGKQGIQRCYILPPLISHCRSLLESDVVDEISIYEWNRQAANEIASAFDHAFKPAQEEPEIFISYSSKQNLIAHEICQAIREAGFRCWMAPESIPSGNDYQEMIPDAISSAKIILLILTPDSAQSRWVQKEVGSAIGAGKIILPYQIVAFELNKKILFLLDGEQIMEHWKKQKTEADAAEQFSDLIQRIKEMIG